MTNNVQQCQSVVGQIKQWKVNWHKENMPRSERGAPLTYNTRRSGPVGPLTSTPPQNAAAFLRRSNVHKCKIDLTIIVHNLLFI